MRITLLSVVALLLIPVTAHAGKPLGEWTVTRYYTPVPGQERYYNGWARNAGVCKVSNLYYAAPTSVRKGDYAAELCMQGSGDEFVTADGTDLHDAAPFTVAACPPQYMCGRASVTSGIKTSSLRRAVFYPFT